MRTERLVISSRFLVVPIITALTLLAWGSVAGAGTPFQKKVGKVAIVAQSGGDYTSPVAAMNDVSTWCGTPSETNPCLVKIMPGVYDLAGGSLTMQSYVDIEGSGEQVTIVSSEHMSIGDPTTGVVNGADYAEIRFLTVKNTAWGGNSAAIANNHQAPKITHVTAAALNQVDADHTYGVYNYYSSPTMNNVTITASGAATGNHGVYNYYSSPIMDNVSVTASGEVNFGIYNAYSSPTMDNVSVTASGGINHGVVNVYSSLTMSNVTSRAVNGTYNCGILCTGGPSASAFSVIADRSTFEGSDNSVINQGAGVNLKIGGSKLIGPTQNSDSSTLTCVASYNGDYVALMSNCQTLPQ